MNLTEVRAQSVIGARQELTINMAINLSGYGFIQFACELE